MFKQVASPTISLSLDSDGDEIHNLLGGVQPENLEHSVLQVALLDQLSSAVIITDLQGQILYWNRYAELLCQWQAAEIVDHPIATILASEVSPRRVLRIVTTLRRVQRWKGKLPLQRKDGSLRWMDVSCSVLNDSQGVAIGYIGVCADVTIERQQTQKALQESAAALEKRERFLATLVEVQRQLLASTDEDEMYARILSLLGHASGASRVYVFINHRSASGKLLTSQRAEWCAEGITPEINNPLLQNVDYNTNFPRWVEVLARGNPISGIVSEFPEPEQAALASQGILSILVLPLVVHGTFFGLIGFDNCSTACVWETATIDLLAASAAALSLGLERRQMENDLRTSEARYRAIVEDQTDLVCRFLPDTTLTFVNGAYCRQFGKRPQELVGQSLLLLVVEEYQDIVRQRIAALSAEDPVITDENPCWAANGEVRWIQWSNRAIFDAHGQFVEYQSVGRDITEERRLRQERQRAQLQLQQQADRERLLSGIATRIRQSLDLAEILNRTVAEVRQFLQTDRVLIYCLNSEESGELMAASVAPAWSLDAEIEVHNVWYRYSQATYEQGTTYVLNDRAAGALSAHYLEFLQQIQVQAKLIVPILHADRFWGVLLVHQCTGPRSWQPFEIDLLEQLATHAAIAIQQAQLFEQVQQRAQREHLLNQVSQALNSSLDLDHILQTIVDRTGECFAVERALLFSITDKMCVCQEWRRSENIPSMREFCISVAELPSLLDPNSDFNQRRVFHSPNCNQELPATTRQWQSVQKHVRSVLSVPILIRDRRFGMLSIQTVTEYRTFTDEEIQLLQRIADQAAIALYNAQSYEYLEQVVRDRTQELEQEKLISEAANRAKSEFLATMSHELRTPLNAVLGLSEVLQEQLFGPLNAKQTDYIHHIHNSGQHLLQLINDILDLAKVELGREVLSLAPVSVFDVCHYCLMLVQEQAFERGLHISSHIDSAAHTCIADERRLRQMLLNLLSNAIKFTPAGSVSLIVEKQPQSIVFTVADTGIGIAADQLPLLFKPFSQLDSQLDRKYPGTGLGLALTRNLAQLHGGKVTVESTLGKGSRFTIELPDSDQSEWADDTNGEGDRLTSLGAQQRRNSGRILIVEDDAGSAMLLQDYLQVSGYQVEHLTGGIDFIQRVRSFKPNLILLDGQLPGEATGLDLVAHLRSQPDLYTIPVVAVTAMAMSGDRERFLQAGANAYLSKPIEIVQLESLLMKYL